MPKNKFPDKMPTPPFRHPHGKGWPLKGKNRRQRSQLHAAIGWQKKCLKLPPICIHAPGLY